MMQEEAKPGRIHWLSLLVVVAGLLFFAFLVIIPGIRLKKYDEGFREMRHGAPADSVVELMGEGDTTVAARDDLHRYWGEETNPAVGRDQIKSVLTWRVRFALRVVVWQVGLDKRGRAVAKHRYE